MADSSYMIAPGSTNEDLAIKRKIAMALMQQGQDTGPVQHWAQGLARLGQSALGGYELYRAGQEDKEETAKGNAMLAQLLGGGGTSAAPAPVQTGNPGDAIASIESGGKYDAMGPVTKTGDRAYGKYQVMGANVPAWTKAHLGQEMTPEQFVASPQAQDAVFKGQFGQYSQKYGPEGAARAWFAGEGGMNDLGRKDQLGTTVGGYGQKFAQALGGGQPAPQAPASPQVLPNREALIQMLGNRKVAPIAQGIIGSQIQQQFKPREYKIEITPDGRVIAADTKDPTKVQTTNVPGAANAAIEHAASKAAAEKIATRVATNGMPATSEEAGAIRKEIQNLPSYKNVTQAAPIYKTMLDSAGRDTRASDLNLVYGLGKIFDPGSVVREGEMVMVKNTASVPDWLVGAANSLNGGAALQPATREAIMKEAHSRIQSYKAVFDQDVGMYRGIADRNKMLHEDVIPSFGEFPEYARPKPSPPPAVAPPAPVKAAVDLKKKYGLD